jgi:hypothetical protein
MARAVAQKKKTFDEILQEQWGDALKKSNEKSQENVSEQSDPTKEEKCLHRTVQYLSEPELLRLDTRVFVDAWVNLCEELQADGQTSSAE